MLSNALKPQPCFISVFQVPILLCLLSLGLQVQVQGRYILGAGYYSGYYGASQCTYLYGIPFPPGCTTYQYYLPSHYTYYQPSYYYNSEAYPISPGASYTQVETEIQATIDPDQIYQDTSAAASEAPLVNVDVGSNDGHVGQPEEKVVVSSSEPEPSHPGDTGESFQENGFAVKDVPAVDNADAGIQGPNQTPLAERVDPVAAGIQDPDQEPDVAIRIEQNLGAVEIDSGEEKVADRSTDVIDSATTTDNVTSTDAVEKAVDKAVDADDDEFGFDYEYSLSERAIVP